MKIMKKIILTLAVVAITLGSTAFAGEIKVDKRIQRAFEKDFAGAVGVKWSTFEDYIKVDFSLNDVPIMACYNAEGEKLAVIRNIQFSILPLVLQFDQKKHFRDYWISQLFELVNEEGTHYHLTVENAKEKIQLVSDESSQWELIRKEERK
jgi:hypothetical protein